jgi:hypothetical protein
MRLCLHDRAHHTIISRGTEMPFDELPELAQEYITTLATNVVNGTHTPTVTRYSGDINDPRARLVQEATGDNEDYTIYLEGYASGEAFQRVIAKGYLKGGWADADTWQGEVDETAISQIKAG